MGYVNSQEGIHLIHLIHLFHYFQECHEEFENDFELDLVSWTREDYGRFPIWGLGKMNQIPAGGFKYFLCSSLPGEMIQVD